MSVVADVQPEVLIVEDNAINLRLMTVLLRSEGFAVRAAVDAEAALVALEDGDLPDIIVMDLGLPGMSGVELTRRLRAGLVPDSLPIVAVTAFAHDDDRQRALAAGCDDFLTKPIDTRTFGPTLRSRMGRRSGPAEVGAR